MSVIVSRLTPSRMRRGFSLPEMLIVIVMLSLLALVAIPRFANANGKRHMESARMRVASALATARAAAIQKGESIRFQIKSNRVTVFRTGASTDTLLSPVPLDTLYNVRVDNNIPDPFTVDFTGRGFAQLTSNTTVRLLRTGVPNDSVVITLTGMVVR